MFNNGNEGTVTDMYFASVVAASRRGYHSLLFEGPGQGAMLYEHQVPLRSHLETVAVDFALAQPLVDSQRIALSGCSLGDHLARRFRRAPHGGPRRDPGTWSIAGGFRAAIRMFSLAPEAAPMWS